MKKILLLTSMVMLACAITTKTQIKYAKAEEGTSIIAPSSTTPTSIETPEETEEKVTEKIKEWLTEYLGESMAIKIIGWAVDAGVMTALVAIYIRYRKYKATSLEDVAKLMKSEIETHLTACFGNLDKNMVKQLTKGMSECIEKMDNVMKALVLAQDKTAEGKIALLNLINESTTDKEVKEATEVVKEEIKQEQKVEQIVKEKVKTDYTPID